MSTEVGWGTADMPAGFPGGTETIGQANDVAADIFEQARTRLHRRDRAKGKVKKQEAVEPAIPASHFKPRRILKRLRTAVKEAQERQKKREVEYGIEVFGKLYLAGKATP